jgi:hypothetical protein
MLRKTLLGLMCCAVVALPAFATEKPVSGTASVTVASTYMWNGFDRVEFSPLSDGTDVQPVVQPAVSLGVPNTGLSVDLGGSFVVNDNSELMETTYGVKFVRPVSPLVTVGAGYTYYDGHVTEVQGVEFEDSNAHEGWGRVEVQSRVGVTPNATVKYVKSSDELVDGYAVVVGGLKYAMPLSGLSVAGTGVSLNWDAGVIYNSGIKYDGVEVVKGGVSAVTFGLNAPLHSGRFAVTPSVNYQVSVEETVNPDNEFWATLGVSCGF